MRAIIRFSVDGEKNSALRNQLVGQLEAAGFTRFGNTATWENNHISAQGLGNAVRDFWTNAATHNGPGRIDHYWMYCDRTELGSVPN